MIRQSDNYLIRLSISIFIIILLLGIFIAVRNFLLKKDYQQLRVPPYIYDADELAKIAKQEHPDIDIIVTTKELGLWDRKKRKFKFVSELVMGEGEMTIGEGDSNKIFNNITAIIADREGNIYVSDYDDCLIRKFDKEGNFINSFSRKGQGPGELIMPISMTFDHHGNICVLDYGNQIEKFSRYGKYLETIQLDLEGKGSRDAFAIDDLGNFYISFWDTKSDMVIHKFDSTGKYISSFCEAVKLTRIEDLSTRAIKRMISAGPLAIYKNELFFVRHNPYEIRKYTTDGQLKMIIIRKNKFMLPANPIPLKDGYELRMPVTCVHIRHWNEKLIIDISIPGEFMKNGKNCHLIDIFDQSGNLLMTYAPSKYSLEYIDDQGKIYASFNDEQGFGKIGRFNIEIANGE